MIIKVSKLIPIEDDFEDEDVYLLTDRMTNLKSDIVAISDVLTFGNYDEKRSNIIDILKRDSSSYIDKLRLALVDEDTETAHYAASAITEYKRKLDLKLQAMSVEFDRNKADMYIIDQYLEVVRSYLHSGVIDSSSLKHYENIMLEVLYQAIEVHPSYYKELIDLQLKRKEYEQSDILSERFLTTYHSDESYFSRLKYHYILKDKESFDRVFNDLRRSDISISNKNLQLLRFWIKDVAYVEL